VNVVNKSAYSQGWNLVLARNASEIRVEAFLHLLGNRGSSLRGSEHHVNQATYVTVRHNFSRPYRDYSVSAQCTQDYRPGLLSDVPSGLSE
jgi:hypothetical protein